MARQNWWPGAKGEQLALVENFEDKIENYETVLGLTPAQITAITAVCNAIEGAHALHDSSKASMQGLTQWRDLVLYGDPVGDAAGDPPAFPNGSETSYSRGNVDQFFAFRDIILAAPGYTEAIGEDLGLIGAEKSDSLLPPTPSLVVTAVIPYKANIKGSLQGNDAIRIEYQTKGGPWTQVGFLTKLPGDVTITPETPGEPESGSIRGVFIEENQANGHYSPSYPVVLS